MTTDEAIAALEAEWTPEDGFFWNLRQGHFRQRELERALNKVTRIQVDEDSRLPRRMVSLLWYIPLFMEWQVDRIDANNGDMTAYRTAIATMTNAVQRILGVP